MINIFKVAAFFNRCKQLFTGVYNPFKPANKPTLTSVNNDLSKVKTFKHNQF